MAQQNLKLVAVRMSPRLHAAAIKMSKREKMSFGEFVRQAVDEKIEVLKNWEPTGEPGFMTYEKGRITR